MQDIPTEVSSPVTSSTTKVLRFLSISSLPRAITSVDVRLLWDLMVSRISLVTLVVPKSTESPVRWTSGRSPVGTPPCGQFNGVTYFLIHCSLNFRLVPYSSNLLSFFLVSLRLSRMSTHKHNIYFCYIPS